MKRDVAVCTLFEGNYNLGAAALINSLKANNFSGDFFVGYRGDLPLWVKKSKRITDWSWEGMSVMEIDPQFTVYFLPLSTTYHFTNYKPNFMLELWEGPARQAEEMYYFDPDIVLCLAWPVFRMWVDSGVALCADVNSPMTEYHPKRIKWREYFSDYGLTLKFKTESYVNGGFVGLKRSEKKFIEVWMKIQESMAHRIGGLSKSSLKGEAMDISEMTIFSPFGKTDQDALNATVEAFDGKISILGRDAMGFQSSYAILPHALGQPKPWDRNYLKSAQKGRSPKQIDKEYWGFVKQPIRVFSNNKIRRKKLALSIAVFLCRFYRRN